MITLDNVRELFDYADGKLFWKITPKNGVPAGSEAGSWKSTGYQYVTYKHKAMPCHRAIWMWVHGEIPEHIDHIDGDTTNNAVENLRNVGRSENMLNICRPNKNNKHSKIRGVNRTRTGSWRVVFRNKAHGVFKNFEEAVQVRRKLEAECDNHLRISA